LRGTLLLDLDGTLVNSVPDLAAALNRLMSTRGLAGVSEAETARMVGDGVEKLVGRAFAARGTVPDEDAIATYVADYGVHYADRTHLYPGVAETLASLADDGWHLAVCTNKLERPARDLLNALGIGAVFSAVGGGDSFPVRKPDPQHLLATIAAASGRPKTAVMVGDHRNDVVAAHGAGIPCIFAAWGYGTTEMAKSAEAIAESFSEVPTLASRLLRARTGT